MRLSKFLVTHAGIFMAITSAAGWAGDAGTIKFIRGDVQIVRDGKSIPLKVGDPVQEKDRVIVPANGSAGISLRDDTRISVGPSSTFLINRFAFDPTTHQGQIETSILRGAMRYISGLISRLSPDAVKILLPRAIIGLRGTDFIVEVGDED